MRDPNEAASVEMVVRSDSRGGSLPFRWEPETSSSPFRLQGG
jgi:hypothetical protein